MCCWWSNPTTTYMYVYIIIGCMSPSNVNTMKSMYKIWTLRLDKILRFYLSYLVFWSCKAPMPSFICTCIIFFCQGLTHEVGCFWCYILCWLCNYLSLIQIPLPLAPYCRTSCNAKPLQNHWSHTNCMSSDWNECTQIHFINKYIKLQVLLGIKFNLSSRNSWEYSFQFYQYSL